MTTDKATDSDKASDNGKDNDSDKGNDNDSPKDNGNATENNNNKENDNATANDPSQDQDKGKEKNQEANYRLCLTIPFDDETKKTILGIQYRLMAYGGGKFPNPDQIYLTLAYIRNQPAEAIPKIQKAMSQLSFSPCTLTFQKVKLFNLRDEDGFEETQEGSLPLAVETWWLVVENIPELQDLYAELRALLFKENIFIKRRFAPHVTLARRTRIGSIDLSPIMTEPFVGKVDTVRLLQLQSTKDGPSFQLLFELLPQNEAAKGLSEPSDT